MALTEDEKNRARQHCGYLSVQESQTFQLGIPAGVQTQFVIEGALNRLLPSAERDFRKKLDQLDSIADMIFEDADTLIALKVGTIELNPKQFRQLVQRYLWGVNWICNMLGVQRNPFDKRFDDFASGTGINVPVRHG